MDVTRSKHVERALLLLLYNKKRYVTIKKNMVTLY